MLKLKNIKKNYFVADTTVEALKGIDLCFRKNEFVSILGPSGCGKTTMLNIIGGLDKYSSGDLFINGRSTSEFNDHDWDVYRNHRIGFIFQSYNLIPHQTILGNVELALTISGIPKAERIERAKRALDRVGLANQYNKKPNQLSGGQCQRVAIARALVNEPEILLADEPTGALDTETSIQIMELIKEIANERLVIMVTHNPDLAEKYSTRIVRLLDGNVIEDSNPFSEEDEMKEIDIIRKNELSENDNSSIKNRKEKAKMSFWTAFKLSAKNLLSKRGRTILTCFAGAIGIIGVSSVLSVSTGVKDYIASMQDDMLSGNPITIQKSGVDMTALMNESSLTDKREALEAGDYVNVNAMLQYLIGNQDVLMSLQYNNEFNKNYVDYIKSMPKDYYQAITLDYGLDVTKNIYTNFTVSNTGENSVLNGSYSIDSIVETYTAAIEKMEEYKQYAELITSLTKVMGQAVPNNDYISSQYDIVAGRLPQDKNDIIIVLDSDNMLTDLLLTQLGYYTQEEFYLLVHKALGEDIKNYLTEDEYVSLTRFQYKDLMSKEFYFYPNDEIFKETISTIPGTKSYIYSNRSEEFNSSKGLKLNICGIVRPKKGISYGALETGFLYTEDLARYIIKANYDSQINNYIRERNTIKESSSQLSYYVDQFIQGIDGSIYYNLDYYYEYGKIGNLTSGRDTKIVSLSTKNRTSELMGFFGFSSGLPSISLRGLGGDRMPESISIYPNDFENKDLVTDYLDKWNSKETLTYNEYDDNFEEIIGVRTLSVDDLDSNGKKIRLEIKYTDSVEIIINMINTMIDIVTYALVAFTALSLVVSCVMIAIITYVSVMERIKEIGVIRSLGGRKKDVSHLFNAETFIIGFASGAVGIGVTAILSLIANGIVRVASGGTVSVISHLTLPIIVVMLLVSVILTTISGFIPAKSAAKKDPVVALRTE
ncbi:MAG: ATP-binding cassette domain-containing protein [Anaeroplasma sp.]